MNTGKVLRISGLIDQSEHVFIGNPCVLGNPWKKCDIFKKRDKKAWRNSHLWNNWRFMSNVKKKGETKKKKGKRIKERRKKNFFENWYIIGIPVHCLLKIKTFLFQNTSKTNPIKTKTITLIGNDKNKERNQTC